MSVKHITYNMRQIVYFLKFIYLLDERELTYIIQYTCVIKKCISEQYSNRANLLLREIGEILKNLYIT